MGSLLLAAGAKEHAVLAAEFAHHGASALRRLPGQATDIMLHAQEILNLKKRLNEIYVKHTGQTYKAIEDALERDQVPHRGDGPRLRHRRQGDRETRRRTGGENALTRPVEPEIGPGAPVL